MSDLPSTLARIRQAYPLGRLALPRFSGRLSWLWLAAFLVAALILLPVIYLVARAVGASNGIYEILFSSAVLSALLKTAALTVAVTAAAATLAVPLAWLTTRTDLPFPRLWSILLTLPAVFPSYVGAYLLVASLGARGVFGRWLEQLFGLGPLPVYGFPGAFYLLTLLTYPYIFLSVRAAISGLDPSLEEAGRSLGLNPHQVFWRITLPQLRPALIGGSFLVGLYVLRDFGAVSLLRFDTFTRIIYIQYRSAFDRSSASVLALILVLIALLIFVLEARSRGRRVYLRSITGSSRPAQLTHLGGWRLPAVGFVAFVVILALLMPLIVLLSWLVRGLGLTFTLLPILDSVKGSLLAGAMAAVFTLFTALPVAYLTVRRPGIVSRWLEHISTLGYVLPGLVIALALAYFGANFALPLYQTLILLITAYVILFLPAATTAVRTALLQVSPRLEEAARSLGRTGFQAWREITLPLIRPGILAGVSLVFLNAMKELPATLLLSPIGYKTLATSMWSLVSEAYFAQAALPAFLLVLLSSVPLAILMLREEK